MENWRAGLIGIGIVLIGLGGYSSLDGVWKGLSLVAAGIALVLLGLSLERKPRPAAASATAGDVGAQDLAGTEAEPAGGDDLDVTVPMAAVAVEEAEPTAPIARTPSTKDVEPEPAAPTAPAAGGEERPAEEPARDEPAMADSTAEVASGTAPADESEAAAAEDDPSHRHDQPMLGHSELVSHIRDYHEGVPFDGSTIQLRLLHERAHAD